MKGIFYGVGTGPGDPELMTLKAVRIIKENYVIAFVGDSPFESSAYKIAAEACPEIKNKILLPLNMPMTRDDSILRSVHRIAADKVEEYLAKGKNVVYITIGDPTIYCSFGYIKKLVESDGYTAETVSGVPSFCAAASRLGISIAERDEPIHIFTKPPEDGFLADNDGTYIIMKSGRKLKELKSVFKNEHNRSMYAVENCTSENEKIFKGSDEIPDSLGYLSIFFNTTLF